jgi:lantibiotic transport system permease protein
MATLNNVSYVSLLRAEFLKYKGTLLMYMAIFAPLLIVLMYFAAGVAKGTDFLNPEEDVWFIYMLRISQVGFGLFYPLHLILVGALVSQVDHSNDTWKHLLVQPVSKSSVYWTKLLGLIGMTLVSVVVFVVSILLSGLVLDFVHPEIGLGLPTERLGFLMTASVWSFSASLGILGIQFAAGVQWKSIAIPLGIGLSGFVAGFVFMQGWEYTPYYPYSYTIILPLGMMSKPLDYLPIQVWLGPLVGATAVLMGWVGFMRKRE